jgi:hypothetical protein
MRRQADEKGVDLLLVDTGDRIEGSGLYDASTPKGIYQYDIFAEQDMDIISTGNHELYKRYSVDCEHNTTVPNFNDAYIASNLDYIDPETGDRVPQAQRYRKFTTKNQGLQVVAFGFIFDFTVNADNSIVQPVKDTIKEDWFQAAIREKTDVFIVAGHVGVRMEEFRTVFTAIRKQNWHVPIMLFGGHVHVRDAVSYDSQSLSLASGRYMETIGWMSADNIKKRSKKNEKATDEVSAQASLKFSRRYIDNNLYGMHFHTGLDDESFPTEHGKNVSGMIAQARKEMELDQKLGCAPRDLYMFRAKYPHENSIYSWIVDDLFPSIVAREDGKDKPRLALINSGGIRFDIFKGSVTKDSMYIVSPFTSDFKYVPDVPYKIASKVLGILNSGSPILGEGVPDVNLLKAPEPRMDLQQEALSTTQKEKEEEEEEEAERSPRRLELRDIQEPLRGQEPALISGYTTKDDIGDDGDDTIHEPIRLYSTPNCVQAEIAFPEDGDPETVDLVFIDFVQPWIIPALKFSGGDYGDEDVRDFMQGTFTNLTSNWIEKNWGGDC